MPKLDFAKVLKSNKAEEKNSWQHYFKYSSRGLVYGNMKFSRLLEINEYLLHDFSLWPSKADRHHGQGTGLAGSDLLEDFREVI